MKITTNTPDLLIVENRPLLLGLMMIGFSIAFLAAGFFMVTEGEWWGLFIAGFGGGMGILMFFLMVRRTQVVFHRPEGWVEIRRRGAMGLRTVRHGLAEISHAETETNHSSDGGDTFRVVLVIDEGQSAGRHPVTIVYTNSAAHRRVAEVINDWLAQSSNRLTG